MIFCPQCGQRLTTHDIEGRDRPHCDLQKGGCGFIDFGQYSLGVGGVVMNANATGHRAILLVQRNQEPNRGAWTLPGGFVENDETVEAAAVREVKEETGLSCSLVGLVAFRNRPDPDANTSYVVCLLQMVEGELIQQPTDEILQSGFYTIDEVQAMERLTPLSRELALAALTDRLFILRARIVPGMHGQPPVTVFMGDGT